MNKILWRFKGRVVAWNKRKRVLQDVSCLSAARTLPFSVETVYGADGQKTCATWQTVHMPSASKDAYSQEAYAVKL